MDTVYKNKNISSLGNPEPRPDYKRLAPGESYLTISGHTIIVKGFYM